MTGRLRTHSCESQKRRYRLMRRMSLEELFFVVCRAGPETRIRAMESLEISSRRPPANMAARPSQQLACGVVASGRRRPPKHVRGLLPAKISAGPFDSTVASAAVDARADKPACHGPSLTPDSEKFSFGHLYSRLVRQSVACTGAAGPIDMYNPAHKHLLARFCGSRGCEVAWDLLERKWRSGCGPACLLPVISLLKGRGMRTLAMRRVNAAFRARGLPPVHKSVFHVPHDSCMTVARRAIVNAVRMKPNWNDDEKTWVLSRVRLVAQGQRKHKSECNAPAVSKALNLEAVAANETAVLCEAASGRGMRRVDKVWDIPMRSDVAQDVHDLGGAVWSACKKLGVSSDGCHAAASVASRSLPSCPRYVREQRRLDRTAELYAAYTADMHVSPGFTVVPDDKQKKFFWQVPTLCYQWLLIHFAMLSPAWELTCLSHEEAEDWCHGVLRTLLPDRVKRFICFSRYRGILPYYYGTVKSKCFDAAQLSGHTCRKAAHSCLRKIVSCCKWPVRRRWRVIHRAWQAIISSVQASDEVFSLKEACHTMDYRIELADVQHGRVCCARCLQSKPQTVALAADAGQFYEVVQPHSAVNAARRLLSRCRRVTGHETVTVLRGPRRRAFLGGHIHAEFGSAVVFTFTELFLAFSACMFLTLVAVGTTVFRLKGLPIGGVLSKVATSLVLGEEERVWKWDSGRRRRLGYAAVHSSWDKEVARARYVDDLLWVSGVYCVPCLIRAICHCYSVEFDVASTGSHVEWLDVVLHVETLSWSMKRKTWVLPPPWGAARHFAHSFISGRLSRFDEVGLGLEAWVEACTQVFMGLRDAGWPARVAKAAAYRATAVRNKSQRAYLLAVCARVWGTMQL